MEIHSSITSSDELMHYGRKGMKWYQNIFSKDKSGSGKKSKSDEDDDNDRKIVRGSSDSSASSSGGKKDAKDMTEAELMASIRHLQLEKQYRDLEAQRTAELNPPKVSKGKEFISDFMKKSAIPALQEAGKSVFRDWLVKVGKETMGLNEKQTEDSLTKLKKEVEILELKKKKTLVEDYYADRQKKAEKQAAKDAEKTAKKDTIDKTSDAYSKKDNSSNRSSTDENDDGFNDAIKYYFRSGGKQKVDSGKDFTDDYVERVKGTVEKDTRTAKERYEQSTGPVYTMDFTESTVSNGLSFTEQYLLEDKSR